MKEKLLGQPYYRVACPGLNSFCATSPGQVGFNGQVDTALSHLGRGLMEKPVDHGGDYFDC